MSENASRWDRRRAETHRRLLQAGQDLFRVQGFDGTTVEQLAAAADVAKGTFFNYFDSKEALLGALLDARVQAILETVAFSTAAPTDRIWQLLLAVRHELLPYLHLFTQMFAYAISHPDYAQAWQQHRTMAEILTELVQEGQRDGTFTQTARADVAGAIIATYFFRVCIMECARGDAAPALSPESNGGSPREGTEHAATGDAEETEGDSFDWEGRMRAGLDVIYRGLFAR